MVRGSGHGLRRRRFFGKEIGGSEGSRWTYVGNQVATDSWEYEENVGQYIPERNTRVELIPKESHPTPVLTK